MAPKDGDLPQSDSGAESAMEDEEIDVDVDAGDPNVFAIRGALEPFCASVFTTVELHEQIMCADIDLSPPYQRGDVWPSARQMELIDSLFHNYYVPPVVFAVAEDEDGHETRVCVDGKQRLTSITAFLNGQIAYRDPDTKKKWWYTVSETNKASRTLMPEEGRKLFATKEVTCVEYRELSPAAERDVFQRVQLGMSLTIAEKMQAISSPWADWITQLEQDYIAVDKGLMDAITFEASRGRNFQNVAFVVYCCAGLPWERRFPGSPKVARWLGAPDAPHAEFRTHIEGVFARLLVLAENPHLNMAFRGRDVHRKVAPAEFVFLGVLLYVMREGYDDEQRAKAAHFLRVELRKQFKDMRLNEHSSKAAWEIIDRAVSKRKFTSASSIARALNNSQTRRPKVAPREEEDGEYRPSAKGRGAAKRTR